MKNKQLYTPVRFSHLTSFAGIGSIVRGAEDKLMAVVDTRYWTNRSGAISAQIIPYVARVSMALGINKELRMPPTAKENDKGRLTGSYLPAVIFPTFAVCKSCGFLHPNPWRKQAKKFNERVICEHCKGLLEQVTWCAISSRGHLDDVPWHYLCHSKSDGGCRIDYEASYLRIGTDAGGRKKVICTRCNCSNLYGISDNKRYPLHKYQPWIFQQSPKLDEEDSVRILEVNDPRIYLPLRENALVIPPESRITKANLVDKLYNNSKLRREIDRIKIPLLRNGKIRALATRFRCSVQEINNAFKQIDAGYPFFEDNIRVGELFEDEYRAFLKLWDDMRDDEDFVTDHRTDQWKGLLRQSLGDGRKNDPTDDLPDELKNNLPDDLAAIVKMVDHHIIAKRLREIQVFKGFYRDPGEENKNLVPPDIVGESDWLPAIELFGEGVFFTLDEAILLKWEKLSEVKKRADEVAERYEKSEVTLAQDITVTPRFLLLHTLSHLLIRELESTSGYPAASLKERIYCSINSASDKNMAGILIYTAVADIVGSLGGIIESAEPNEFLALLDGAFKHAGWCSLDPVCTEHEGQGPGWLNRAACHACALIPEPGCQYNNLFLDRVFIKGSDHLNIPNFLEFIIKGS